MAAWVRASFAVLVLISVVQCSRNTDFLHRIGDKPVVKASQTTKVKEVVGNNRLDLLWVVDNSGSMMTHQKNVIDNTEEFMKAFTKKSHIDWKMGLLSTHVGDKPYVGFAKGDELDRSTPDPVKKFQSAIAGLGWNQGCPELVFEPVIDAVKHYPRFFRANSYLVVLSLTDTMEEAAAMQTTFEAEMRKLKPRFDDFKFYGTYAGKSFACQSWEPEWEYPGSPFEYFVNLTGGEVFKLCGPDFGTDLARVAENISSLVERGKVFLTTRPQVSSLEVIFQGKNLPGGHEADGGIWLYDFDLNAIIFHNLDFAAGDQEAEVQISFDKAD